MPAAPEPISAEDVGVRFKPGIVLGVAAAAAIAWFAPIPGLSPAAHRTLVILVVVTGLWVSESLPVAITALLVPLLAVLFGVTDPKAAFAGFGDPIIFLFLGTFMLAEASAEHGLNDRLARGVLGSRWVAQSPRRLLWAIAALGCGISAWVSNTATTAMLLPLALTAERLGSRGALTGALLICAYAPSLGGLATPVGSPPNLIGLRLLEEFTGSRPSFAAWCAVFAPLALIATAISAGWLSWLGRGVRAASPRRGPELPPPGPWSLAERALIPVFVMVVLLWITPGILAATPLRDARWLEEWQRRIPEPMVPVLGALLLFLLPSGRGGARILRIGVLRRLDWSTLLLFGGGLSLGGLMFQTGLAKAMGEAIFDIMPIHGTYGVVLAATLAGVLMSELTSNTASASLVVPVVLALSQAAGVDPVKPALAATAACSFGFMLPVSTPPNAIVYGTGRIPIKEMIRQGVALDLVGIALVSGWVTLFG